ncbi:signal peptide peptidase [Haematococcus lacustris]
MSQSPQQPAAMASLRGVLSTSRKVAGRGLAILGAGALASSLALAVARWQAARADKQLPEEFVVELDLERLRVVEQASSPLADPLALIRGGGAGKVELRRVVRGLQLAGQDSRVQGLLLLVGDRDHLGGPATIQEVRDAILRFRLAAGPRGATTTAFAPTFGEAGQNGSAQYYLASAAETVVMQPLGSVGLLGLQSQMLFLRGLLDKLKVAPIFYTREDYKTAGHMFTQTGWTPAHQANTQALLQDLVSQMWEGVAVSRGVSRSEVEAVVEEAPLLGPAAAASWVVNQLLHKDQLLAGLKKSARVLEIERAKERRKGGESAAEDVDDRLPRISLTRYLAIKELAESTKNARSEGWLLSSPWAGFLSAGREKAAKFGSNSSEGGPPCPPGKRSAEGAGWVSKAEGRGRPKVAVVHAAGPIVQGPLTGPASAGQQVIDATRLAAQLQRLSEARDVHAVVLRINTPGGSALGSDTVHHALGALRQAGKRVVVSCGDVAASGGMFIVAGADRVVAQPGTLTGSIGVVIGKFDVQQLLVDNGVNPASMEAGSPNLTLFSPFTTPNQQQEALINRFLDDLYLDFLSKVAAGRGKSVEDIRPLAGGRVFTGQQALKVGLVDELGGLQEAVATAKKLAGLPVDEDAVMVFDFPPRRTPWVMRLLQAVSQPAIDPTSGVALSDHHDPASWGLTANASLGAWTSLLEAAMARILLNGHAGSGGAVGGVAGGVGSGIPAELASAVADGAAHMNGVCLYSMDADMLARSVR